MLTATPCLLPGYSSISCYTVHSGGKGLRLAGQLCAWSPGHVLGCHQTRTERRGRMRAGCCCPQAPVCTTVCTVPNSRSFPLCPSPGVRVGKGVSRVLLLPAPESGKPAPGHLGRALRTRNILGGAVSCRCSCPCLIPGQASTEWAPGSRDESRPREEREPENVGHS